jgi:hypothetical protein
MTPRAIAKITEGATDFAALGTAGMHAHASESYQDARHPRNDEVR